VTRIGKEAFYSSNLSLNQVHLGANIEEIGADAFFGTLMTNIDLDPANAHFTFEGGVLYSADHKRAITMGALKGNRERLNPDVVLHDNVEIIDNGFARGRRLNTIKFGPNVKWIGAYAFELSFDESLNQPDLILPDGIEYIGKFAFLMCIRINNLHLPDSLTRLEPWSFAYVSPEYIHMPKNLKVICDNALCCVAGNTYRNLVLPEGLDSIGEYGITSINCDSLIVPSTVRYLSKDCLDNLSRYIEIKAPLDSIATSAIPSQAVRELVLPKTLRRLEHSAFYPCYDLKRIVWPDALEYIGPYALAGNKIEPMVVPPTVRALGRWAFADNVWEPRTFYFTTTTPPICLNEDVFEGIRMEQSTLYVPRGAKQNYANKAPWSWFGTIEEYDEIVLPPVEYRYDFELGGLYYNVVSDEELTCEVSFDLNFITDKNTYEYKSVTIPETVTYEGKTYTVIGFETGAFSDTPLHQITLPQTITYIDNAFSHCPNLASIDLPENVITMSSAFNSCTQLKSIHLPDKVEAIDGAFYYCTSLEHVNIPKSVTEVEGAFYGCSSLTSLVFPDGITDLGIGTCTLCENLNYVKLPANLLTIGDGAFSGCRSLESIVLPSQLDIIHNGAFEGCYNLTEVISLNPVPPFGWGYGWFQVNDGHLHVPAGCKEAYQQLDIWRYFNIAEDAETISHISLDPAESKAYDLTGRPVDDHYKGIVIKGGKLMPRNF